MPFILFPDEQAGQVQPQSLAFQSAGATGIQANQSMGMISLIIDVNNEKAIKVNDGTNDRILIGYQLNGF